MAVSLPGFTSAGDPGGDIPRPTHGGRVRGVVTVAGGMARFHRGGARGGARPQDIG